MLDVFNINNSLLNQVFYNKGVNAWQVWHKPSNCNFVHFYILGGGAGGQGGPTGAGSTRTGGVGGGSAAMSYITVPAFAVPNMLYVLVASGGTGGASGSGRGGVGGLSYVSTQPDSTFSPYTVLMQSGIGNAGAATSATAGAVITSANIVLAEIAFLSAYAGQTGGAGGVSSGAAANVSPNGLPTTAGAGGAGVSSVSILGTSGSILSILDFPRIAGGTSAASAGATRGGDGFSTRQNFVGPNFKYPMFFTGGAGGGSSDTGVGANGGNGAFGCGGGGGGAGGNVTAGSGGNGGDGLVIITAS
jgi:hypothetical protein